MTNVIFTSRKVLIFPSVRKTKKKKKKVNEEKVHELLPQ